MNRWNFWIRFFPSSGFLVLRLGQEEGGERWDFGAGSLLEHDDAADEGGPEGGAPGGGKGEDMGQLGGGDGACAGGGTEESLGDEEDARGKEAHGRHEPRRPPHRSPPIAGVERGGGSTVDGGFGKRIGGVVAEQLRRGEDVGVWTVSGW